MIFSFVEPALEDERNRCRDLEDLRIFEGCVQVDQGQMENDSVGRLT